MKRQWETEELIEQFMLMPSELALLPDEITNATAHNRLGVAARKQRDSCSQTRRFWAQIKCE
ncbi:hypothetical protein IQ273_30420 [Nodosilinea sp. LEGE 07298]|uniref:hypothetical protein n=1 Tax=Nodosilinea sp. LEGE 07298 TaxID=2777970 RepID=UPI001881D72A|nr:hypothetical protein [Nodosilinea sp. LEGE 07298]MBE9113692.1 hypothetical protein [Nodosilinea sp. LEGE 07298]